MGIYEEYVNATPTIPPSAEWIELAIRARNEAYDAGNDMAAIAVRLDLRVLGIELEDTPHGTKWRVSP